MTTRRLALIIAPLLALALGACRPADLAAENAALQAQADAWDQAIVRKDSAAIAANLAHDFRQIDTRGNVEDRATFLAGLVDPALTIDPYTVEDFDLRRYGDVALLCGRTRMTGHYAGEPFATHYRYIDVYARRDGRWQVVSVQTTRIPD